MITMSRAGTLIAIIALAALTLAPEPSLAQSYKPGKHEEPNWCEPEAYCDTDEDCHTMYPCKHTACETSRRYTDKTWPKQGKCVCEGKVQSKLYSRRAD